MKHAAKNRHIKKAIMGGKFNIVVCVVKFGGWEREGNLGGKANERPDKALKNINSRLILDETTLNYINFANFHHKQLILR